MFIYFINWYNVHITIICVIKFEIIKKTGGKERATCEIKADGNTDILVTDTKIININSTTDVI